MKHLKFFLPFVAILLIAAGVFAMKANKKVANTHIFAEGYYEFVGSDPSDAGQRLTATNYVYIGPDAPTGDCATGHEVLCGIKTEGDGVYPIIPATGDIHTALQNNDPLQDEVFLHNE